MKKKMRNVILALIAFVGFSISVNAVTINFRSQQNGGTNLGSMNVTRQQGTVAITVSRPTRNGYTFKGWTGTDLTGPTMTVIIPTGSLGARSFTATWEQIVDNTAIDDTPTSDPETTGEGYSDLDDVATPAVVASAATVNPQTNDDVIIYISLLAISGYGLLINKKRLYN